jgi:mRNA-degrading endonuclease RelE of RelBE toxin-antitoxin system
MNAIEWKLKALKQLKKIPTDYQKSITRAVDGLRSFRPGRLT